MGMEVKINMARWLHGMGENGIQKLVPVRYENERIQYVSYSKDCTASHRYCWSAV